MELLVAKYERKLIEAGLAPASGPGRPLIGGLDYELVWNRNSRMTNILEPLFSAMAINSLVWFEPAAPFRQMIRFLAEDALKANGPITPMDCETRTFLHDLPVISSQGGFSALVPVLKQKKCLIIADHDGQDLHGSVSIVAHGTVSPEQGFVTASSVIFACFVKFFSDYLTCLKTGQAPEQMHRIYDGLMPWLNTAPRPAPRLAQGPLDHERQILDAMDNAGAKTVEYGLVDSYFGNISLCRNGILYISQTGSSLDELKGCIDPVPLDGSSTAGLTASSELTAHMETIRRTGYCAILHGHPKFSVIMSMDCDPLKKAACPYNTRCHILCPEPRFIHQVPIVPGEVGTGPTGLCNTLPQAFEKNIGTAHPKAVIVYGHGLFTIAKTDFNHAFATLMSVETACKRSCMQAIADLRNAPELNPLF